MKAGETGTNSSVPYRIAPPSGNLDSSGAKTGTSTTGFAMHRVNYAVQADRFAALAASAKTAEEREACLSSEKLFRKFAEADRKISQVRDRNPSVFARREPRPLPAALRPERAL
jgi:hypothetical protein